MTCKATGNAVQCQVRYNNLLAHRRHCSALRTLTSSTQGVQIGTACGSCIVLHNGPVGKGQQQRLVLLGRSRDLLLWTQWRPGSVHSGYTIPSALLLLHTAATRAHGTAGMSTGGNPAKLVPCNHSLSNCGSCLSRRRKEHQERMQTAEQAWPHHAWLQLQRAVWQRGHGVQQEGG